MIKILTGKTCSGKDTIMNELRKRGVRRIVTYTTRPMRYGEADGKTYHFVTDEKFKEMIENDEFFEYTSYTVSGEDNPWYYGTSKASLDENGWIIMNPYGIKKIKESRDDVIGIYVNASDEILRERLSLRGDDPNEAERRLAADNEDFKNISELVDVEVFNEGEPVGIVVDKILIKLQEKISYKAIQIAFASKKVCLSNGMAYCPTCGNSYGDINTIKSLRKWEYPHCKWCGQKLDWNM